MRRMINVLLVLSLTGVLAAQGDAISADELEIVYTNEPVKSATVKQADDAVQEVVAQESEEEIEITNEQDDDLQSDKTNEVTYEEYN